MSLKVEKTKKINSKRVKEYAFCYGLLAYPLILFAIFYLYVNINSFLMAFQQINVDGSKQWLGLDNFRNFIAELKTSQGLVSISLINSLKMYFINLVVCMPLYILFSYVIFKRFMGMAVVRVIIMLPAIISSFVFCLVFKVFAGQPLQQIMVDSGFENFPNLLSDPNYMFGTTIFYMIWVSFSTSLIVYPNAMNSIDPAVIESSKIDGVRNLWQELRYIILPLIFPTISTFLITGFATILTNSGPVLIFYKYSAQPQVYNMGYYMLVKIMTATSESEYPIIAAGGLLITIIVAPLTMLLKTFLDKINPVLEA